MKTIITLLTILTLTSNLTHAACAQKSVESDQPNEQFDDLLPMFPIELQRLIREYAQDYNILNYMPAILQSKIASENINPALDLTTQAQIKYEEKRSFSFSTADNTVYYANIANNFGNFNIKLHEGNSRYGRPTTITSAAINANGILIYNNQKPHWKEALNSDYSPIDGLAYISSYSNSIEMVHKNDGRIKTLWNEEAECFRQKNNDYSSPIILITPHFIVAGCDDGIIRIWNLNGNLKSELRKHKTSISALYFSEDESLISKAYNWDTIIWSTSAKSLLNTLTFKQLNSLKKLLISLQKKSISLFGSYQPEQIILSAQQIIIFKQLPRLIQNNICSFLNCGTPAQLIERSEKANQSNCCIQ